MQQRRTCNGDDDEEITTTTTIATAVATGDHDTPLFAESRLHRQVQRVYLVPLSGMERDRERQKERGRGKV